MNKGILDLTIPELVAMLKERGNGRSVGSTQNRSAAEREQYLSSPEIQERIQKQAYEFYLERGCQHGNDQEDWIKAEDAVLAQLKKRKRF